MLTFCYPLKLLLLLPVTHTYTQNSWSPMRNRTSTSAPSHPPSSGGQVSSNAAKAHSISSATWIIIVMFSSCISFYVGVWTAWSITSASGGLRSESYEHCINAANGEDDGELGKKIGFIFKSRLDRGETEMILITNSAISG